jgi:Phosphopantetheine attachment site
MGFPRADREPQAGDAGDPAVALLDAVHDALRGLLSGMLGAVAGSSPPAPHVSLFAIGGGQDQAVELAAMLSAVFGLDLPGDTVVRSPTPDSLARSVTTAWFEDGNSLEDLVERLTALAEDE